MKLREHPGISLVNWVPMSGSCNKQIDYECASLTNVALSRVEPITICYLTTEIEDETYMGTMLCKDSRVCGAVYDLLKLHLGKPMSEIGELDLQI